MRIERTICDVCGIEASVAGYRVPDGSEPDPSGNGQSENVLHVDLCNRCAGRMMDAGKARAALENRRQ